MSLPLFCGLFTNCVLCNFDFFYNLVISFGLIHGCHWIMQVASHLVKLVLRNNAITTLHGIENLKSLEGLDVSYNVISNFSELEVLAGLPSLLSLWLEGNPICSARWYRAQVFSLFTYPDKVSQSLLIPQNIIGVIVLKSMSQST